MGLFSKQKLDIVSEPYEESDEPETFETFGQKTEEKIENLQKTETKKRVLAIIGLFIFISLALFGTTYFLKKRKGAGSIKITPVNLNTETAKGVSTVKLTTWEDQAGFIFTYPQNLTIDSHPEDTQNYSHLELTLNQYPGRVLVMVSETDFEDLDQWVQDSIRENGQVFETTLGGRPARKILYSEPRKQEVAAIDVDALVRIEMLPDEQDFWRRVFDQVVESFEFIPIKGEESAADEGSATSGRVVIQEPEEVIE